MYIYKDLCEVELEPCGPFLEADVEAGVPAYHLQGEGAELGLDRLEL